MIRSKIIKNAKIDYDKYHNDFNIFSKETFSNYTDDSFFECYVLTLLFKNWREGFNSIRIDILNEIYSELHQDVNSSYYLSNIGLYRTANMHIRSIVELALQGIYFYEHPIELEKWKLGKFIIKYDKLSTYIKEHPRFIEPDINNKVSLLVDNISRSWVFFSKHIHAESLHYFQTQKKSDINNIFVLADFNIWKDGYTKTIKNINKLYLMFYAQELKRFPSNNQSLLKLVE